MSRLRVFAESDPTRPLVATASHARIAESLAAIGVRFERWQAAAPLRPGAPQDEVIAAYRDAIDRLMHEGGYRAVDVVSLAADHPDREALRRKFLDEHTHAEDEVRFFVAGQGLFTLHPDDRVYEVLCQSGDLISVPAGTRHWFDMGPAPRFIAIRLFTDPAGWVARYTGADLAARFPRLEAGRIPQVIVDIEGTVGSLAFVREVLFPYAREHLPAFLRDHAGDPEVRRLLDAAALEAGLPSPPALDDVCAVLTRWIDEDRKATALKALQGMIWDQGFRRGELVAHVYEDAARLLRQWHAQGRRLHVYSSGSVAAQRLYFSHSTAGDLSPILSGHFDTTTGPKRAPASYRAVAHAIEAQPGEALFLSDVVEELDAAAAAGMRTCLLARDGASPAQGNIHPVARDFDEVDLLLSQVA